MNPDEIDYLFIVSSSSATFISTIEKIKVALTNSKKCLVISLDPLSSSTLREEKIRYRTPECYYNREDASSDQLLARKYAEGWFKEINSKFSYEGISIGEMLELDFYYLFSDSVRSVKIARAILSEVRPKEIVTPNDIKPSDPNSICYETLANSMRILSTIHITDVNPNIIRNSNIVINKKEHLSKSIISDTKWKIFNLTQYIKYYKLNNKRKVVIFDILVNKNIELALQMKNNEIISYRLSPFRSISLKGSNNSRYFVDIYNEYVKYANENYHLKDEYLFFLLFGNQHYNIRNRIREIIESIEWAKRTFILFHPDMYVVLQDISPKYRAIARYFKLKGVIILVVQHGITGEDMSGLHVLPKEGHFQAVWGEMSKKWHVERGKDSNSQIITGNPNYDNIVSSTFNKTDKSSYACTYQNKKKVLIVTQWYSGANLKYPIEYQERFYHTLINCQKQLPDVTFIVKLHPSYAEENRSIIQRLCSEENVQLKIFSEGLMELISISDIVVIFSSTVGLTALMLDKPLIVLNLEFKEDIIGLVDSGLAIAAYNEHELIDAVKSILANESISNRLADSRHKTLEKYIFKNDGKSSERISELISNILIKEK